MCKPEFDRPREVDDPFLASPAPPALAGVAPDLVDVLRRRRARALERREAERDMRRMMRERPDLFWSRPAP